MKGEQQVPGTQADSVTVVSPEDGGYPRDTARLVRLGPSHYHLDLDDLQGQSYFMVEAINHSATPRLLRVDLSHPPEPPYYYCRTPDGRWHRSYLADNAIVLTVQPGTTRLSTIPYYTYSEYLSYVESLHHPYVSREVTHTDEGGTFKIYRIKVATPGGARHKMKILVGSAMHNQETSAFYMCQGIIDWLLSGDPATNLNNVEWYFYPCFHPKAVYYHYQYKEIESEEYDNGLTGIEAYVAARARGYHLIYEGHMWNNEHQPRLLESEAYDFSDPFLPCDGPRQGLYHYPGDLPLSQNYEDWVAFFPHWFEYGTDEYYHRNCKYWTDYFWPPAQWPEGGPLMLILELTYYGKDAGGDVVANIREQGRQWARAAVQVYLRFQKSHNYWHERHPIGPVDLEGATLLPKPRHTLLETLEPVRGNVIKCHHGRGGDMCIYNKRYDHGLGMQAGWEVAFAILSGVNSFKANVAVDDAEPNEHAEVQFVIRLNDEEMWRSRPLHRDESQMAHVSLPGEGILTLALEGPPGTLGDWGGARFTVHDPDQPDTVIAGWGATAVEGAE